MPFSTSAFSTACIAWRSLTSPLLLPSTSVKHLQAHTFSSPKTMSLEITHVASPLSDSNHPFISFSNTSPSIFCLLLTAGHHYASIFSPSFISPVFIFIPIFLRFHGSSYHLISCQYPTVPCLIVFVKPCLGTKNKTPVLCQSRSLHPTPCLISGCWVLLAKSDNLTPQYIHNQKP